jgi:hypothetical protein
MDEKQFKKWYETLTDEQKERAKVCKTPEELMAVLGELGVELPEELRRTAADSELSDEELDAVSGGATVVTEDMVDQILNLNEPYTIWVEASGKYHGAIHYMFSWNQFKIGELSGARRAEALEKTLGPGWYELCTPEVCSRLRGW